MKSVEVKWNDKLPLATAGFFLHFCYYHRTLIQIKCVLKTEAVLNDSGERLNHHPVTTLITRWDAWGPAWLGSAGDSWISHTVCSLCSNCFAPVRVPDAARGVVRRLWSRFRTRAATVDSLRPTEDFSCLYSSQASVMTSSCPSITARPGGINTSSLFRALWPDRTLLLPWRHDWQTNTHSHAQVSSIFQLSQEALKILTGRLVPRARALRQRVWEQPGGAGRTERRRLTGGGAGREYSWWTQLMTGDRLIVKMVSLPVL